MRKKEIPAKIGKLEESFAAASRAVDAEKHRLEELTRAHRASEENLRKGVEQLKKTKDRLLDVKTNKEYQAMLKEIETLEKKNSEIEDDIILKLEEMDSARKELKTAEQEFEALRLDYEKEKKELEKELDLMDSEISGLLKEQEGLRTEIETDLLKKYDRIRSHVNGRAVVPVWKSVCDACHMNIPPQMYNELQRSEEIMQCPFCSRIIYWDDRGKNG